MLTSVRSAISLIVGLLLSPLLIADLAKLVVLLLCIVLYALAVVVDLASYCCNDAGKTRDPNLV
jgi:hypothetical protein